jgi:hypothetical protein
MQQFVDPERTVRVGQVEIGHASSEEGMSLAEVVVDVETERR